MQRWIVLLLVVVVIAAAILYLEKPEFLRGWLGRSQAGTGVELGLVPNPAGEDVGLKVGQAAPDFALKTLDGQVVRLSDYRGQKYVLVNFWASWCGPCKVEMPDLEEAYQQHQDELVVLGVDLQERAEDVRRFLADEVQVSYPILMDGQGKVQAAYNLFTQPTSYLLDLEGIIRGRKFGAYTRDELLERVQELLAARSASAPPPDGRAEGVGPAPGGKGEGLTGDVRRGPLNEKYFGPGEIKQLGVEVDLTQVPYRADVKLDRLKLGCPVVDCIPSIDSPRFQAPEEVDWLLDDALVIGLSYRGVTKAYPVKILNWHEIVNDRLDDAPVVISYCPLCNSAVAFLAPTLEGQSARFGVSGRLYQSDLVMYDRVTYSLWSQIEGRAIVGPLAGASPTLERLSVDLSSWGSWQRAHPNTLVLARPRTSDPLGGQPARDPQGKGRRVRDYGNDPYAFYKKNNFDTFGLKVEDKRLENKDVVIGVELGEFSKAYPRAAVVSQGLINDSLQGAPLVLVYDARADRVEGFLRPGAAEIRLEEGQLTNGSSKWDLTGQPLSAGAPALAPLVYLPTFWFAWAAFHPQTEVFSGGQALP